MLKCFFHPTAEKELARLPRKIQEQIKNKIKQLSQLNHPLQHPKVKKLKGTKLEVFRLRSGDYRIIFILIEPNIIKITHIRHRGKAY